MWMKFGDDWSKTATCIAAQTNKQTDERAIEDCVLAKISENDDKSDDDNDMNVND